MSNGLLKLPFLDDDDLWKLPKCNTPGNGERWRSVAVVRRKFSTLTVANVENLTSKSELEDTWRRSQTRTPSPPCFISLSKISVLPSAHPVMVPPSEATLLGWDGDLGSPTIPKSGLQWSACISTIIKPRQSTIMPS